MKKFGIRTPVKSFVLCLLALGFVALARGEARADEVHIAGFTFGCFGECVSGPTHFVGGLTFNGSTFSGTTANGFRGLGGNPNPAANFNNLGSLSLSSTPQTYDTTFELDVVITAPQGVSSPPGGFAPLFATLTGTVRSDDQGGVFIDFDNTPILFTFSDPNCEPNPTGGVPGQQTTCGDGSFFFSVNDVAIDPGQVVSITGQITGAQQTAVPEPMTMILFGTGLSGVAAAARRRRKTSGS